jgi:acyl carrier protein phosphodiesterase
MNFLAHQFLSGGDHKLMVGNFIADFVKGRAALEKFDAEIVRGIELHRSIDAFTDVHPIVSESKNRLRPKYRHYAGVIVDVFYDHLLARNWSAYHQVPLPEFAANVYQVMQHNNSILPGEVKGMLPYMIRGNWLVNYAKIEGIHRALSGMSSRTPYLSKMEEASEDLRQNYDSFKDEFSQFFPALQQHCRNWIGEYPAPGLN